MHPLDNTFKKKLSHVSAPVEEYNWDKIAARLDQMDDQKPRHIFLRSGLGAVAVISLLCIGVFMGLHLIVPSPSGQEAKISMPAKKDMISNAVISSSTPTNVTSEIVTNSNIIDDGEQAHESASNSASSTIDKINVPTSSQLTSNNNNVSIIATNDNQAIILTAEAENIEYHMANASTEQRQISVDKITASKASLFDRPELTLFNSLALINDYSKHKPNSKITQKIVGGCPFSLETNNKSLEVFVSHDLYSKTLNATDPAFADVLEARNQSEYQMYSYTVGARFGYNVSNRWRVHVGASYSQQNEKFKYIDPETNQEREITTKDYIRVNGVIVDSVVTTKKYFVPGEVKFTRMNRYSSFDIPLVGRYTIFGNKDLSLSTTVGPIFNISYAQKGTIIGDDLEPLDLSNSNAFKPQLGVKLYGGLSLAYHIAGDLDIILEPHAKIAFDNVTKDKAPIQIQNQVFGIHTGVRYRF